MSDSIAKASVETIAGLWTLDVGVSSAKIPRVALLICLSGAQLKLCRFWWCRFWRPAKRQKGVQTAEKRRARGWAEEEEEGAGRGAKTPPIITPALQHTSAMLASLPTPARSTLQRSRKTPKSNKVTFEAEQTKRKWAIVKRSKRGNEQSFEAEQTKRKRELVKRSKRGNEQSFEAEQTKRKRAIVKRSKRGNEQSFEAQQQTRWNESNEEVVDMTSFLFETCGLILTGDVTFLRLLSRWHKLRQEASTLYFLSTIQTRGRQKKKKKKKLYFELMG